ncbi:MAG TPA: glyoxalase superfamily protein [Gemmatimonadales bacterium]
MPFLPRSDPDQFYQGAPLLEVPDVASSADFYRTKLGFRTDPGTASPEYAVVWRENAAVHLTKGGTRPAGVRIFFWVKDVDALHAEFLGREVPIDVPLETRSYGIRDFSVRDHDGVVLIFGQDID